MRWGVGSARGGWGGGGGVARAGARASTCAGGIWGGAGGRAPVSEGELRAHHLCGLKPPRKNPMPPSRDGGPVPALCPRGASNWSQPGRTGRTLP